ncbi:MAG TPA: FAD-dependent oxidoreductase [bacterium]|nr:FAD-dependent oxidoreductase [bacterium]
MSSLPLPGAPDAQAQAYPVLTDAQVNRVRPLGTVRRVAKDEILFDVGDTNVPCFVVLSGHVEIVQPDLTGERTITTYGPGQFTGEMTLISGHAALARARVTEPGEVLEVCGDDVRSLVATDAQLSEILMRAFILRRQLLISRGQGNVIVLGSRHSANTLRLREFLTRNDHPYTYVDLDADASAQAFLDRFQVTPDEIPVLICNARSVLRNPSIQELADCLGLNRTMNDAEVRDLIIVGAGPAGLAAAVYAASEGLNVLVIEAAAPGGQAGSSSKIENYLGFPTGVSGQELADLAIAQAEKFGASFVVAHAAKLLDCGRHPYAVVLDNDTSLSARAVIIATGAQYNKPALAGLEQFEGQGIYYAATHMESQLCEQEEVIVVGGGNSAGQAAVFLSQTARRVHILVRSGRLADTMSRYLVQRIEKNPAIDLHYHTEMVGLAGGTHLERVTWLDTSTGETSEHAIRHVFIMAGASPRTDWLQGCIALDDKGFILTGRDVETPTATPASAPPRAAHMLETSRPRVFAVGDIRSGSVKRVASAVGEGAIAIHLVHRALAEA